jgi:pimeloyl-ACP methyl ester carboxylesterase
MREIYLISGLGADKRVFGFVDLSGFKINHVDWIDPVDNESIERYAKRLVEKFKFNRPILIGVSFGGMVAVEIAKQIETEKIILISSAKTKFDIPLYFRILGQLRLNKIMPASAFKKVDSLTYWFFGTKTTKEKELLRTIIEETDARFLRWAIDKIINWKNTALLTNLIHIHGNADKILPRRTVDYEIQNGGHLMIINRGNEVGELIRKILERDQQM